MARLEPNIDESKEWPYTTGAYIVLVACGLAYLIGSLLAPQTAATIAFQMAPAQRVTMQLSIIIPVLIVWIIALRAALTFKNYSRIIEGSPEARGVGRIADGLMWLVAYLVLTSILSVATQYFVGSSWLWMIVAIKNHLPVIASLIAFFLIFQGSLTLKAMTDANNQQGTPVWLIILFGIFAAALAWLFAVSPVDTDRPIPIYGLPHDVNLFTMILPHTLAWFIGLLASINILNYTRHVKGLIYRQALRRLVWGILSVILFAAVLQLLTILSKIFSSLSLGPLLLIVYVLIVLYGMGFILVHLGAKKLTRIEVVQ